MIRPTLPASLRRLPVAHRALHNLAEGRPENSLSAIRAAIAAGYAIEIDLQPTADGEVVVFHDDDLARLTGEIGPVTARTLAELQELHLLCTADRVPSLKEVLALVDGQVPLLIELKPQAKGVTVLEEATAPLLAHYQGDYAVMSFNPESMARMAELLPGAPRGLTTMIWDEEEDPSLTEAERAHLSAILDYERVGASFISHHHVSLDQPRIAELKAQGAAVLSWTLRSAADEATARKFCDNITFEGYQAAH